VNPGAYGPHQLERVTNMALHIEDQMLRHLQEKEEQRCRMLEEENRKTPKKKGIQVKRRKIQKPWTRFPNEALCQETELLLTVSEFDYDLSDESFQEYCRIRGVLHIAGNPNSRRWYYVKNHDIEENDFRKDRIIQYEKSIDGEEVERSKDAVDFDWKIISIGRAKIQDCWEINRTAPGTDGSKNISD